MEIHRSLFGATIRKRRRHNIICIFYLHSSSHWETIMHRKTHKAENVIPKFHKYSAKEISEIKSFLLEWYDENKRQLPWRNLDSITDLNTRAYAVLVSEVMLQQTQVATVINYYVNWMKKWPTMELLALAPSEEIREAWAGLGYYSRAERLHRAVSEIVNKFGGSVPRTAEGLQKLPGIGRYTSCAVASIVFNEPVAVVDGNVTRVIARLRTVGNNTRIPEVNSSIWSIANEILDHQRPGDFNQAIMELGATVCTPKTPACVSCPIRKHCRAFQQVKDYENKNKDQLLHLDQEKDIEDIESCSEDCSLCLPKEKKWDPSLGVRNYPAVAKKLKIKQECLRVCIFYRINVECEDEEFFVVQRPKKGLLANLWEFPCLSIPQVKPDSLKLNGRDEFLKLYQIPKIKICDSQYLGEVTHVFSHLTHTYYIECLRLIKPSADMAIKVPNNYQAGKWCSKSRLESMAISSVVKKILRLFINEIKVKKTKKRKQESSISNETKQRKLSSYFSSSVKQK